jgi:hypothetical protein
VRTLLFKTIVTIVVLFSVYFGSFIYFFRYLTDSVLSEDQKSENVASIFGYIMFSYVGISIVLAVLLLALAGRVR